MRNRLKLFLTVGAIGFLVQIAALIFLTTALHWRYEPATAVAVELAILHNFWWHERWTWRDRSTRAATLKRWYRFQISAGCISMVGNLVGTACLVEYFHLVPAAANVAAVAFTSLGNFLVADRWVFLRTSVACAALLLVCAPRLGAAELNPEILAAWNRQTADAQARLRGDRPASSAQTGPQGRAIHVSGGSIHLWRGSTLVRHATVDQLLAAMMDPGTPPPQEDVLESRVLARLGSTLHVYVKLRRTAIVTVVYDTEHDVSFRRASANLATSESVSTRIAETNGGDRGFLWRLNAYWRYVQVGRDVLVELESLSLSRDIPLLVRPIAGPIINGIARESMRRTLDALEQYVESAIANRADGNPASLETRAQPGRQSAGPGRVAVDADRVGLER